MLQLVASDVLLSVCLSVGHNHKTAEPIEMPFGMWTQVGPSNHVLGRGLDPPREGAFFCGPLRCSISSKILDRLLML